MSTIMLDIIFSSPFFTPLSVSLTHSLCFFFGTFTHTDTSMQNVKILGLQGTKSATFIEKRVSELSLHQIG